MMSRKRICRLGWAAAFCLACGLVGAAEGDWHGAAWGRWKDARPAGAGRAGFTSMEAGSTGVAFTNLLAETRSLTNQIYLNGSGVAAGDVDGDGWCDLFFAGLDRGSVLYRNRGNWRFEDVTAASGLPVAGLDASGAVLADVDGDGDLDLVFNTVGRGTHLYLNDGKGRFTASPQGAMNGKLGGMSLALGDMDGDGDLDLYVANYRTVTIRDQPNTRFSIKIIDGKPTVAAINGRPATDPDLTNRFNYTISAGGGKGSFAHEENGEPDLLLRNEGGGRFTPLPLEGVFLDANGQALPAGWRELDWGLSVVFRDINQDGAPDLYVCNDFKSEDRLWLNTGQGRFRAAPAGMLRHTSLSSMGVDFSDINHDGWDDFFVADMLSRDHQRRQTQFGDTRPEAVAVGEWENRPQYPHNTLFLNGGDGTYREIAQLAGLEAAEWAWAVVFMDVDLDGFEDVLVSNGFERDNMNADVLQQMEGAKGRRQMSAQEQLELRRMFPRLATPNLAFRNLGELRFEETGQAWGFAAPRVSNGMALADLDNDGDQDVVVNNLNDAALVYRNDAAAPRVAVRLKGAGGNTQGIGARIELSGGPFTQAQEIQAGGRYLSSDEPLRVFAARGTNLSLKVRWSSGRETVVGGVEANRIYEISEAGATAAVADPATAPAAGMRFEDVSARLAHTHRDEMFDDFARQPLLPNRLSQLGPGVTWFDVDGDGWDDLLVASGKGGRTAALRNDGRGGFQPLTNAVWQTPVTRDQTTLLGLRRNGQTVVLAGSANYEDGLPIMSGVRQFSAATGKVDDSIVALDASTGPLALADVDGDGDLDLFRGGRVAPGKYPAAASSWIYKENGGKFELDAEGSKVFAGVGLVSGAVFADLNGDGWPDLALACEWGPVRVFMNDKGRLTDRSEAMGLSKHIGWWTSVAAGDFDGDGRLDLVAGNWGWNHHYEAHWRPGLRIVHGDFDGDGSYDVIESYFEPGLKKWVPRRNLQALAKAMPGFKEAFPTHAAFAVAGLAELPGVKPTAANQLEANWLETTVLLNRGDQFEAKALPIEAQFAPVFGVVVADFDSDGAEDLFLAQNFFAVSPETTRLDAGWGICLAGNGRGGFKALTPTESGLRIAGEQRGAAAADFDHDGRVDLAVGQNGGVTKLYRNTSARSGVRIALRGPSANPRAVGAVVRWKGGSAHSISAGSGYWSADSPVLTLARPEGAAELEIRWPGGKQTVHAIPPSAREIICEMGGTFEVVR